MPIVLSFPYVFHSIRSNPVLFRCVGADPHEKVLNEEFIHMLMRIFLIRHGESESDVEERYGGSYDDNLSQKGEDQARILAANLKDKDIRKVYHSPLKRASQTADIISTIVHAPRKSVEDLAERNNYGILTGMKKDEAASQYPEEAAKLTRDGFRHDVEDSEEYDDFKIRVIAAFEKLLQADDDTIAVVTHGGVISTIVREYLKMGELDEVGDCAYVELEIVDDDLTVTCMENTALASE